MTYPTETDPFRPLTPEFDREAAARRAKRINALGLALEPQEFLDEFAKEVAEKARVYVGEGQPIALVNLITTNQYVGGLSVAGVDGIDESPLRFAEGATSGYCPHVIKRRKALVLDDVCDYPRFAGNPIVDGLGVRTYIGAPLIDPTGEAIGTLCVVDIDPRPWGQPGLHLIKDKAAELMQRIQQRAPLLP